METRCEICGCLTEEEQLTDFELAGESFKVCTYCKKGLEAIAEHPDKSSEQAVNMFSMENSHRSVRAQKAMGRYFASLGVSGNPVKPAGTAAPAPSVKSAAQTSGDEIKELSERLTQLENKVERFRKRYYISKALGIAIPVLLIVIAFIVMVASGALENLANYYDTIMDYANM